MSPLCEAARVCIDICATRGCQALQDVDAGVHSLQYFEDV